MPAKHAAWALSLLVFVVSSFAAARAGPVQFAQINAFLPDKSEVPLTGPLPIDGVWTVSTIGKRIRIDGGRAYAVDPWIHLFVLKVQPDMVVLRNFRRIGPGKYTAEDLPLQGPATMQLQPDGTVSVTVQGAFGLAYYSLIQTVADDPVALDAELATLGSGRAVPPPSTDDQVRTRGGQAGGQSSGFGR